MTTVNGNRRLLDLKRWEFCTPSPVTLTAGSSVATSRHSDQLELFVFSAISAALYDPFDDAWILVPSPALTGTYGAGASGAGASFSTGTATAGSLTATAGSTTTITTNQTLARCLRGYKVQFLGGTNAGEIKTIASNTIGANAVITFTAASGAAFDATSVYRLLTPTFYVVSAGTLAAGSFRKYCFATNSWISLTITGLPATLGTDGRLISTAPMSGGNFISFATGTATSATSTTLVNSGKTWTVNQWANSQVRITAGTGNGQICIISSNTGTTLTVSSAWTVTPDATSQYSIEGCDDYLYYLGNNAVTMYRYSISANTWSTLSPGVARTGVPGVGMSAHWISSSTETDWTNESAIQNGRYIYSFRGAAGALLDRYDIAANSWAAITYSPATETLTTGSKYTDFGGNIYIQKDATGRWFKYDCARNAMTPWSTHTYPSSTGIVGEAAFTATYTDGATSITYVYHVLNSLTVLLRQMVF